MMMLRWTESGVCGEPDSGRKLELGRGRGLHILRPGSPKVWLVWLALGWGGACYRGGWQNSGFKEVRNGYPSIWQGGAGHGRSPNKLTREDFGAGGEIKQPWFVENEEHLGGAELITPSSLETKDLYNHSSLLPFSPVPS